MNITESIKFNKLKEENEKLKNQLAEKDKELVKLKQQILFKEDFDLTCYAECNCDGEGCGYGLKDNSKYDKLPSKDVK
ncbi:MAG: hypothetical protein SPLM_00220 [Spiroplasma phoeniceum]|uniref:hypothetical protein n=1 Tax=Spiroplasma phoeniceum TaxID=47835 RepID=UPI003294BBD2